jgi:putative transcriptional regulator
MIINHLSAWRARRGKSGITKAALARRLGVSRSYITKLEQGTAQPSLELALRIACYFGCSVEEVFQLAMEAAGDR